MAEDNLISASGDNGGITDIFQYASSADGQLAAKAIAKRIGRTNRTLELVLEGLPVIAGAKLKTEGFLAACDYDWVIKSVRHSLTRSGWVTTIQAEGPNPES